MAQKILSQEWERLKTRTDLEVCIYINRVRLCMSLYVFHLKVDRRRCLLQLTSYAAALQDSNVGNVLYFITFSLFAIVWKYTIN